MAQLANEVENESITDEPERISDFDRTPFKRISILLKKIKRLKMTVTRKVLNEAVTTVLFGRGDKDKGIVFGDGLYNENCALHDYDMLNKYTADFIQYDIYKTYGLNIDEYMDRTIYEMEILNGNSERLIDNKNKHNEKLAKQLEDTSDTLTGEWDE